MKLLGYFLPQLCVYGNYPLPSYRILGGNGDYMCTLYYITYLACMEITCALYTADLACMKIIRVHHLHVHFILQIWRRMEMTYALYTADLAYMEITVMCTSYCRFAVKLDKICFSCRKNSVDINIQIRLRFIIP